MKEGLKVQVSIHAAYFPLLPVVLFYRREMKEGFKVRTKH